MMNILIDSIFSFSYNTGEVFDNISYGGYELLYLLSGSGCFIDNERQMNYKANDIFFADPNYQRTIRCYEQTQYACIRFRVVGSIDDVQRGLYSCPTEEIYSLFKFIFAEYKKKEYRYYDLCNLKTQEIIMLLARLVSENNSTDQDMTNLIKEIDNTLRFDKTVQEMADELNYSYDYFRHKFKKITGHSTTTYINNRRIQNACDLLKKNMYSCTEISNLCGFSSSSQFSKIFKREIGITPLHYQKHVEVEPEQIADIAPPDHSED